MLDAGFLVLLLILLLLSLDPSPDFECCAEEARSPNADLIERKKTSSLPADEASELNHYIEIEHLMRLAKARARQLLAHG